MTGVRKNSRPNRLLLVQEQEVRARALEIAIDAGARGDTSIIKTAEQFAKYIQGATVAPVTETIA